MKRSEELEKEFNKCKEEIKKAEEFIELKKEEALIIKGKYLEATECEKKDCKDCKKEEPVGEEVKEEEKPKKK